MKVQPCVRYTYLTAKPKIKSAGKIDLVNAFHFNGPKNVEEMIVDMHVLVQARITVFSCPKHGKVLLDEHSCAGDCSQLQVISIKDYSMLEDHLVIKVNCFLKKHYASAFIDRTDLDVEIIKIPPIYTEGYPISFRKANGR